MLLRFAAALSLLAIGLAGPTERAAAQGSQGYPYVRGGNGLPPGAVVVPDEDDEEESIVMVPEARRGLPYPPQQDRYVPQAPGFIYPDREEPQPPYGHMPSRGSAITRGELPPGTSTRRVRRAASIPISKPIPASRPIRVSSGR